MGERGDGTRRAAGTAAVGAVGAGAVGAGPTGGGLTGTVAIAAARAAAERLAAYRATATAVVAARLGDGGAAAFDAEQRALHGLAWIATLAEAARQAVAWAARLAEAGTFGAVEEDLLLLGLAGLAGEIVCGPAMSQVETVRPGEMGLHAEAARLAADPAIVVLVADPDGPARRRRLVAALVAGREAGAIPGTIPGASGLEATLEEFRAEISRFVAAEVTPHAQRWHRDNAYIPLEVIDRLAGMGVFGLTIPEAFGGLGLPKEAMCVVTEELSRGYLGVGSLGTRSEIAAELILAAGTEEQKRRWLPGIAAGEILTTAVFTEPDTGSDLGALRTRAVRDGDVYRVNGAKTWITHAARADLMTILVRTDPGQPGWRGLSMLVAEKPRGDDATPFPVAGMGGGEIEVLGYRGMKEFEIGFDGFAVPAENLLGGVEGQGFKQLMQTFEAARVQTAARAVGVAQNALDLGLAYAVERRQFGRSIVAFPRIADKLAAIAVEVTIARQLTYFAARAKDEGRRADLEAGMAKLLAARVAWAAADAAVQIHGGNGFALEYPVSRLLCDARILSIFEGAAEIQAQVIARRIVEAARAP
jgi:(2S)-methylsuccinyl-CoA dehydrogenase